MENSDDFWTCFVKPYHLGLRCIYFKCRPVNLILVHFKLLHVCDLLFLISEVKECRFLWQGGVNPSPVVAICFLVIQSYIRREGKKDRIFGRSLFLFQNGQSCLLLYKQFFFGRKLFIKYMNYHQNISCNPIMTQEHVQIDQIKVFG